MNPIRIALVDDHTLVRAGMRALLDKMAGVDVVAEASDGREALRLLGPARPDLVLMDIAMRGLNGLEAASQMKKDVPQIRVIILSMHANEEYVIQALHAGAMGYLLKDAATAELEVAVRAVARGQTYLSPVISKYVITNYLQRVSGGEEGGLYHEPSLGDCLTPRQREILQLIAEGSTTREIAETLHLSVKTIETHRSQLMERLDIHDIAGLVRYAIRTGVIASDW
jgi:DNA-binding NarL/FixJ family response regulator